MSEAITSMTVRRRILSGDVITLAEWQQRSTESPPFRSRQQETFDVAVAYELHGKELYLFSLNAVRDAGAAEECVQEIFTRAWKARRRFDRARGSLRTWLFAIARNVIKDSFRRRSRVPEPVGHDTISHLSADLPEPEEHLILIEALATLSTEHRQAIIAIHVLGLNYAELSESTDVPVATLRSRTYYGLQALRRHFTSGEEDDA